MLLCRVHIVTILVYGFFQLTEVETYPVRKSTRCYLLRHSQALRLVLMLTTAMVATSTWANDPSQPGQLRAVVYSSTAAEVMWARSTDDVIVAGYEIVLNDQVLGIFDQLSYFSDELTVGSTYRFKITAVDNQGNRSVSSSISLVAGDGGVAPSAQEATIRDARIDVYSRTAAELFWSKADTGVTTRVFRNDTLLGTSPGNSFFDDSRQADTQYRYTLETLDDTGRV